MRRLVEGTLVLLGVGLVATAIATNQRWLDRHFLPSFFIQRQTYVLLEMAVRVGLGALGACLVLVRQRIGRAAAASPSQLLYVAVAAVLGLAASEVLLRVVHLRPAEWLGRNEEPLRQADARIGWTFVPSRTGRETIGGRNVDYTFDAAGFRVRRVEEPVDATQPTALFTGESVMFGKGLTWEESIPAQVGKRLGAQSANIAVDGYGNDQAYLRLETELPRFRHPVAVVSMFITTLLGRNLDDDRPHLGPGLEWRPAVAHGRLRTLLQLVAPYRRDETVDNGIAVTREILRATAQLAMARHATPLVLVLRVGPENDLERRLRQRVLDDIGVPFVGVEIDPAWRLSGDVHPNADAARVIADAVAAELMQR